MSYIKVNLEGLNSLREQIDISKRKLGSIISDVEGVQSGLDWDVAAEEKINVRLMNAISEIEDDIKKLSKMSNFLSDAFEWYRKVEEDNCKLSETYMANMRAKGEAILKEAKELKLENARKGAVSLDDSVSKYLADIRNKNENFFMQAAAYGYNFCSFKWLDAFKKMTKGSEMVDDARRNAFQAAYASTIGTDIPSYSKDDLDHFLGLGTGLLEQVVGLVDGNNVGAGAVSAGLSLAVETGLDISDYYTWSDNQKELFFNCIQSADENLKLLNELKTVYAEDKVLVDYCDGMIEDINKFLDGENLNKIINSGNEEATIVGGNVAEFAVNAFVPEVIEIGIEKLTGVGGVVTAVGSGAGYVAEAVWGTGTTAEALENVDILYTSVECSVNVYNEAMANGNLSAAAQKFSELSILNQKIEAIEMSTDINRTFGEKGMGLVESADGMIESLQHEYDVIADNGQ